MLVLARKINESVVIDGRIIVKIVGFDGDKVRLGIQAPSDVPVHREEVYLEIQRNNREAVHQVRPKLPRILGPGGKAPVLSVSPGNDAPNHAQQTSH